MTHHPRPSFTLSDTTFHFVDAAPATVLDQAREAAQGRDVRLGGGATVIRQFLDADLVDTMHVAVARWDTECGGCGRRGSCVPSPPDPVRSRPHEVGALPRTLLGRLVVTVEVSWVTRRVGTHASSLVTHRAPW
jgi:hypothetical protein